MFHIPITPQEQAQVQQLRSFWQRYRRWIVLLVAGIVFSGGIFTVWQQWSEKQDQEASGLFWSFQQALDRRDIREMTTRLAELQSRFGHSVFAPQAALLATQVLHEKGQPQEARQALMWAIEQGRGNPAYLAAARLRLVSLLMDNKEYNEALRWLSASVPEPFMGLLLDRRGDVYQQMGQVAKAKEAYQAALMTLDDHLPYKSLVKTKLESLTK
jgi:predicted negative regulator of RcsB-dependent stress response